MDSTLATWEEAGIHISFTQHEASPTQGHESGPFLEEAVASRTSVPAPCPSLHPCSTTTEHNVVESSHRTLSGRRCPVKFGLLGHFWRGHGSSCITKVRCPRLSSSAQAGALCQWERGRPQTAALVFFCLQQQKSQICLKSHQTHWELTANASYRRLAGIFGRQAAFQTTSSHAPTRYGRTSDTAVIHQQPLGVSPLAGYCYTPFGRDTTSCRAFLVEQNTCFQGDGINAVSCGVLDRASTRVPKL